MGREGFYYRNEIAAATAYSMREQTNFVTATNLFDITTKSIFCWVKQKNFSDVNKFLHKKRESKLYFCPCKAQNVVYF